MHGGLRYLQQGELTLVYEALAERQRLRRNAPHLVRILPFLIPILSRDGVVNPKIARALGTAMWGYDLTGGLRIGKRHRRLSADAALAYVPTMPPDRLASAYLYYDARADDARLCLTVARTAAAHGAAVVNYAAVTGLTKHDDGTVSGATVALDGTTVRVRARVVVNATGVWSDDFRALDEGAHPDSIRPAKGIHVTLPWEKVRNEIAVVIPVPKDRRSLFVVPWGDLTYVGTTDTDYDGPLDDPQCTPDDIAYVLGALNQSVTTGITPADVVGSWAGLRPLVKQATSGRTADLSRRHRVRVSPAHVVSVTGGKLTTYRRMAADTVDEVMKVLDRRGRSRTKRLRLIGADGFVEPADAATAAAHLAGRYGGEARDVEALIDADPSLAEPLVPGLPYLAAEAVHAARHEMAAPSTTSCPGEPVPGSSPATPAPRPPTRVARLLAAELGWDDAETDRQVRAYLDAVNRDRDAAGLPAALAFGH